MGAISPDIAKPRYEESTDGSTREGSEIGVTFKTAGLEQHYRPIESYEGYHRYDPKFDWEPEEERKVVRKVQSSPVKH